MRRRMWLVAAIWLACLTVAFPGVGLGAVIKGKVIDADTGSPLPSASPTSTFINLFKLNVEGNFFEFIAGTNCFPPPGGSKEGCANANGDFSFSKESDGTPLVAGDYKIDVFAQAHFPNFGVAFEFDGVTDENVGVIALAFNPVEVSFQCCPPPVPSNGGKLTWSYRVTNVGSQMLKLDTYSIVSSALTQGFFAQFQVGKPGTPAAPVNPAPQKLNLSPNKFKNVNQSLQIPGELKDGCCICVTIYVTEAGDPFTALGQNGFCVSKGGAASISRVLTPEELSRIQGGNQTVLSPD